MKTTRKPQEQIKRLAAKIGTKDVSALVKDCFNCAVANIDLRSGDIWIANPQVGHWLQPEKLQSFLDWVGGEKAEGGG